MNEPIIINGVIARSEQGATRPFFCSADSGKGYRLIYCVKGRYAGGNSLCCEWVASRLASLVVEGEVLNMPPFRMAEVPADLVAASARPDIRDLGVGRVFASLLIVSGQELTWTSAQNCEEGTMAMLLLIDLWLQNEDRTLSDLGGNPNLLVKQTPLEASQGRAEDRTGDPPRSEELWAFDFNLAFDADFSRERFFGTHVFGGKLKRWPEGFRELMEPRLRAALAVVPAIFAELPREWLHPQGDETLPVQLDLERVVSVLNLPFTDPDNFWKLP